MLSDKFLPTAVALAWTAVISLFAPWVSKMLHIKTKTVAAFGGLLGAATILLLVLVDLHELPKPQSWVGPVLLPIGVVLWAIVIYRLQARVSEMSPKIDIAVAKLVGPPNMVVLNGGSVEAPLKYSSISALNTAIDSLEGSLAVVSADRDTWEVELKKDRDGWKAEAERLSAFNLRGFNDR
jgi:hypothetical protein